MKHIAMSGKGEASVMIIAHGNQPECLTNEVLIKVGAAGSIAPDVVQRQGLYPPPPGASPILGLEVAGEVIAIGPEVKRWRVGDRVCALVNGGGYAEAVSVPETQCLPIPAGLSVVEAASLPETCFTVWSNLFDRAHLKAGEILLVHGGKQRDRSDCHSNGFGFGVRVFATAGSDEKCRVCESLGAEAAINYRQEDFAEALRIRLGKQGVDVILDMVGGDYINKEHQGSSDGRTNC